MINEIVQFIESLPAEVFSWKQSLQEGLYIKLQLDETGNPIKSEVQLYKAGKKESMTELLDWCLERQVYSRHFFDANRSFDSSKKIFIYTASPFAIGFKKKSIAKEKVTFETIQNSLNNYFRRARALIDPEHDDQLKWVSRFEQFCKNKLFDWIKEIEEYHQINNDLEIWIYLEGPTIIDYKQTHQEYLLNAVLDGEEAFAPPSLLSKFPDKKMFMAHQTAPFVENRKISRQEGKAIWQFFELQRRGVLPNPLPVFIDKRELNEKVVRLYNQSGERLSYSEIIKALFENYVRDLANYYLFFFVRRDIVDLDFVSSFKYQIEDMYLYKFFRTSYRSEVEETAERIQNVFQFERSVANVILNNQLVRENRLRYFGNINPKHIRSDATYVLLMKYRQALYDYIYKSRKGAITTAMFHDIMQHTIKELIRLDKDMKNDFPIRERLDIWFSLYHYFDLSNQNATNMINKTREILEHLQQAVERDEPVLRSDDDFAFAAGQLIRYLLQQSQAGQRTHALLEPFLQKVQPAQFKQAIAKTFDTYKHEITLYSGTDRYPFDKLMSEVMGYEPDTTNMKELLPMVLAGYFAKSVLYSKKSQSAIVNQNA